MLRCMTTILAFLGLAATRCQKYFGRFCKNYASTKDQTTNVSLCILHIFILQMIQDWYSLQVEIGWRGERAWLLPYPWNGFPLPLSFWAQRIPPLLLHSAHSSGELLDWCVSFGELGCLIYEDRFHLRVGNSALLLLIRQHPLGSIARCIRSI